MDNINNPQLPSEATQSALSRKEHPCNQDADRYEPSVPTGLGEPWDKSDLLLLTHWFDKSYLSPSTHAFDISDFSLSTHSFDTSDFSFPSSLATCSDDEGQNDTHRFGVGENAFGGTIFDTPQRSLEASKYDPGVALPDKVANSTISDPDFDSALTCRWEGCPYSRPFNRKEDVLRHIREMHIGIKPYRCHAHGCDKSFSRRYKLLSHMLRAHQISEGSHGSTIKAESNKLLNTDQDRKLFRASWDLPLFVADIPVNERLTFMLKSITLTKSGNRVKVLTGEEFIQEKYGKSGIALVINILRTMERDHGTYGIDDNHIGIKTSEKEITVLLSSSTIHLYNLVLWLALTFRQPKEDTVCLSTCTIDVNSASLQTLAPAALDSTCCWFSLFESAVIAVEPHIKWDQEMFLETTFHLMLQLAAVEYPVLIDDGLVLMGYSTALVPVKLIDDKTVLWHLEVANHDSQIKTAELSAIKGPWFKTTRLEDLQSKKALLGWCPEAITLLGTGQLGTVQGSNAKAKQTSWTWKGANLQFIATTTAPLQLGGGAGLSFDRTINTLRFSAARNYLKCLHSSATEQIVLYDVGESRAWLVPLICVFHEMLLAYWRGIPEPYRQPNIPLANPKSDGAAATYAALRDCGGHVVEGTGEDRLTIRELILGFSANLSRTTLHPPGRAEIYGYEFMDIMKDSHKSDLKRSHINKKGLPWISLLDHFNCLFCSGLGDAIRGSKGNAQDSPCNQLPRGNDWLAASMHSIEKLNSRYGGNAATGARQLSSQHYWCMTGLPFDKCDHAEESKSSCWSSSLLLQDIKPHASILQHDSSQLQHSGDGAVVFGRLRRNLASMCHMPLLSQRVEKSVPEHPSHESTVITLQSQPMRRYEMALTVPSDGV